MLTKLLSRPVGVREILSRVRQSLKDKKYLHILSLNPEIAMCVRHNVQFADIYWRSDSVVLLDGVGVSWARRLLGISHIDRLAGADLIPELVGMLESKRILFIGGKTDSAKKTADKFLSDRHRQNEYFYLDDVDRNDTELINKVSSIRPDILFVAFGSPYQEMWIENHRHKLSGIVCMGVGGGLDFLSGNISRAPKIVRRAGVEWLYRLIIQPWRVKRQANLLSFVLWVMIIKVYSIIRPDEMG
jgi:N-acetylglucosaminyldiphosphoundecaprenol N-acetyl-beta-D-mannosaminyltransferase